MRVEVDDGHRAVRRMHGAQHRQRDRVVTAEREQAGRSLEQAAGTALDRGDGLGDVERVDPKVAGVRHLLRGERRHAGRRVVRPEQPGGLPDVRGTEPRTRAVADPGVERDAEDRDIRSWHVGQPGQPGERRLTAVPRYLGRVDLADDSVDGDARLFPGKRPALRMVLRHSQTPEIDCS